MAVHTSCHITVALTFIFCAPTQVELLESMCTLQQVPFDMHEIAEHLLILLTRLEGEAGI